MRAYKWLFIGGSIMLLASFISLFFDSPYRVSATSGPNCDLQKCSFIDTTINDFQVGQFNRTGLNNIAGDGAVQLLPVGLTSPWITDTKQLPGKRYDLAAVVFKDYVYVIGGRDETRTAHSEIFRATMQSDGLLAPSGWITPTNLPTTLSGMVAVVSPGPSGGAWLYVLGGSSNDQFGNPILIPTIYYNFIDANGNFPEPNNWRTRAMPPYGFPSGELVNYQAVVHNGYLYVIGGQDTVFVPYVNIFRAQITASDGSLGTWTEEQTNLPTIPRKYFAATTWTGPTGTDWLYLMGGLNQQFSFVAQAQVDFTSFNNSTGSLNPFASQPNGAALPFGYYGHGAVQFNGALFVTAGDAGTQGTGDNITTTVQSALINDDGSLFSPFNAWVTSNPLPQGRKFHASVVSKYGEIYVIGGLSALTTDATNTVYHGSTRGFGSAYAPNGNYVSNVINMTDQRNVNQIAVNTTITNPVTMTLQYRYGNGINTLGNWITLPNVPAGVNINSVFPVNFTASYFQYRAYLTTTVSSLSPALNQIEVRYPPPPTPTPTATTPPIGGTPTPTRIPGIPDFAILGIQSPASTESLSQTITVRVANQGTGFNRQPISRQSTTAIFGQQTTPRGGKRTLPSGLSRTPRGANAFFVFLEMYVDPSVPPTQVTQLGNCPTISGGTNWGWVYALGAGEYVDVPIECYINAGTHQYYSQVDSCDDLSGALCSTSYGQVQEGYETNNIFGPALSGSSLQGGIYLPYIQKSP